MSKYTTEVRFICEREAGLSESRGLDDVEDILDNSWYAIFKEDFPIFDEGHRAELCKSILRHYYLREICCETVAVWKMWLRQRMKEIMPKYNVMYEANARKFDFLNDVDLTTERDKEGSGSNGQVVKGSNSGKTTSNVTDDSNSESWDKYSDTPQGALDNVKNGTYLTNARNAEDTGHSTSVGNGTNESNSTTDSNGEYADKENVVEHVKGKRGGASYTSMMREYRESAISIDAMIIDELSDLFMLLW